MKTRIGIIGPTNMGKFSALTGKTEEFLFAKGQEVGQILARNGYEVWVNSDGGMMSAVALGYKDAGGKDLVVLYPEKGEPWPNKHIVPYSEKADRLNKQPNWFWTNYQVVTLPHICICVGLSAGVLSELAYVKWNCQFKRGNLKWLVVIQELVREQRVPPEIEIDVKDVLMYVKKVDELTQALGQLQEA